MANTWEQRGPWSGVAIRQTRRGWLYESWSAEQGARSGLRIAAPFGALVDGETLPGPGADLHTDFNGWLTVGEWLARAILALSAEGRARVLSRGHVVH